MTAVMLQRRQAENERMERLHELQERALDIKLTESTLVPDRHPVVVSTPRPETTKK